LEGMIKRPLCVSGKQDFMVLWVLTLHNTVGSYQCLGGIRVYCLWNTTLCENAWCHNPGDHLSRMASLEDSRHCSLNSASLVWLENYMQWNPYFTVSLVCSIFEHIWLNS
jgi:hypothetical protein